MKWIIILIPFFAFSQLDSVKYNLSNTITGSTTSNTKQTNLSLSGDNTLKYRTHSFSNTTNYSVSWVTKKIAEEFSNKSNFTKGKWFCLYMFTHSLTRKIDYDNSVGIGYIHWWKDLSLSYGVLGEKTIYTIAPTINVIRHSVRTKVIIKWLTLEYYYQPNILKMNDIVITGNTKITLFQGKKVGLVVSDVVNYRSTSITKLIHSTTLNINFVLTKK